MCSQSWAAGEFHEQIQVTARPRGAPDHRAKHLQAQTAMGCRDALQRRSQPAQLVQGGRR